MGTKEKRYPCMSSRHPSEHIRVSDVTSHQSQSAKCLVRKCSDAWAETLSLFYIWKVCGEIHPFSYREFAFTYPECLEEIRLVLWCFGHFFICFHNGNQKLKSERYCSKISKYWQWGVYLQITIMKHFIDETKDRK